MDASKIIVTLSLEIWVILSVFKEPASSHFIIFVRALSWKSFNIAKNPLFNQFRGHSGGNLRIKKTFALSLMKRRNPLFHQGEQREDSCAVENNLPSKQRTSFMQTCSEFQSEAQASLATACFTQKSSTEEEKVVSPLDMLTRRS